MTFVIFSFLNDLRIVGQKQNLVSRSRSGHFHSLWVADGLYLSCARVMVYRAVGVESEIRSILEPGMGLHLSAQSGPSPPTTNSVGSSPI